MQMVKKKNGITLVALIITNYSIVDTRRSKFKLCIQWRNT